MGNYKFKFSDMIPNSWFYKLKDGGRTRNSNIITNSPKKKHQRSSSEMEIADLSVQRKSYHFSRDKAAEGPNCDTLIDNLATNLRDLERVYPEPPMKSSTKRRSMKRNRRQPPQLVTSSSSVSAGCSCKSTLESVWSKPPDSMPESYLNSSSLDSFSSEHECTSPQYGADRTLIPETFDDMLLLSTTTTCRCGVESGFIIDKENKQFDKKGIDDPDKLNSFTTISEYNLPPIVTKPDPAKKDIKKKLSNEAATKIKRSTTKLEKRDAYGSITMKVVKEDIIKNSPKEQKPNHVRRSYSVHSPGLKLRTNSPRIGSRRIHARKSVSSSNSSSSSTTKKDLSDSFAVVKSSRDPQRDFKESMVEMIVENNMFASKDLEELLACYLSLNSDEYHEMIIKVFKQIWFDIIDPQLK